MSPLRMVVPFLLMALIGARVGAQSEAAPPMGARAQLGIGRIVCARIGVQAAISPDGKYIAASIGNGLSLLDRVTGKPLTMIAKNGLGSPFFSADSSRIAGLVSDRRVEVRRIPNGDLLHVIKLPGSIVDFRRASISGDGSVFAVGTENKEISAQRQTAFVVGARGSKAICTVEVIQNGFCSTTLSSDGKTLATWGNHRPMPPNYYREPIQIVQLWEVATGNQVRRIQVDGEHAVTAAFAPDGRRLATVSDSVVQLFDLQSGKEVQRLDVDGNSVSSLRISPDGRLLVACAEHALVAWNLATNKWTTLKTGRQVPPEQIAFPGKDQMLVLGHGRYHGVYAWNVVPGTPSGHFMAVTALGYSPNGKMLFSLGAEGTILKWDPGTGSVLREWTLSDGVNRDDCYRVALSANGRLGVNLDKSFNKLNLLELDSGKARETPLNGAEDGLPLLALAPSPDGRRLATTGTYFRQVTIWDIESLKRTNIAYHDDDRAKLHGVTPRIVWSAGGRRLAVLNERVVLLLDAVNGTPIRALELPAERFHRGSFTATFSHDGNLLAVTGDKSIVTLQHTDSGKEIRRLTLSDMTETISAAAFSPDGCTVAFALAGDYTYEEGQFIPDSPTVRVQVWEMASGRLRCEFVGHSAKVNCLAFSPDSQTLASGSDDTTVIVWDVGRPYEKNPKKPPAPDLDAAWKALAQPDAKTAFRAQDQMRAVPSETLAFLRKRLALGPPGGLGAAKLKQLVADLDSDEFTTRDAASGTLQKLGEFAEPALRNARAGRISLEMSRRIEKLLGQIDRSSFMHAVLIDRAKLTTEELQAIRAIEVVERIGSPEAKLLLESLVGGPSSELQRREALAALARMNRY